MYGTDIHRMPIVSAQLPFSLSARVSKSIHSANSFFKFTRPKIAIYPANSYLPTSNTSTANSYIRNTFMAKKPI